MLSFDPRLSASEIISCDTCHNLGTDGVDAVPTSVGHGWKVGLRRAPAVYNGPSLEREASCCADE
ncbi:cytochrome-c peroxidase [Bradyrhizobium sp. S3.5.5]